MGPHVRLDLPEDRATTIKEVTTTEAMMEVAKKEVA